MSYLPGLRASLVEVARREYAQASEKPNPAGARRRRIGGGLATALAAAVAVAVAVVAVVSLGHRQSSTRSASRPGVTRMALRQSALRVLRQVALPPGAVASRLARGTPIDLWSPPNKLAIPNRVDIYRVWRLRLAPDRVIAYIVAHRPPGSSGGMNSEAASAGAGGPVAIQMATAVFWFPGATNGIWRELALNAVALPGGGTALRVDSEAGWLKPRPASERIPRGTERVVLTLNLRSPLHRSLTITNRAHVNALVLLFNSLPSAQTGTGLCKRARYGSLKFAFEAGHRKAPLAVAVWAPPCRNLGLTIGGRVSVPLMADSPAMPAGAQIAGLLAKILPPRRVSTSVTTLHSAQRCASSTSSTQAQSQSAPGAPAGSCASARQSTRSGSSP
jgi:hypothetical protein